ncbi:T9SS type A sorting domain-containing protein [Hymenobacter ruricola]|uniref:T9SS type A sorting domain-containing protein n=1 Tax=Hymenobacter ruricola TaxID=2791023 RepID=A0ABS0I017_9BACT|nr:T9SS type A sorting domain-containing protein [Hymenobacter ruricola]MBF9220131.1 T9SS type A sorting domain-containing protein [Hymenobacter ruricola]
MLHFSPLDFPHRAVARVALGLLLARGGAAQAQTPATFAPVSTYPTGFQTFPFKVAVLDVNGDGRRDIVTADSGGAVGVLLGQTGGGFAAAVTYAGGDGFSTGLAVADTNGDGRLDLVVTNSISNTVGVLLGQPAAGFAPVITYRAVASSNSGSPTDVAVADVNGDGRPDILTANPGGDEVGVLLGLAGGGFAPATVYPTGSRSGFLAVADVNGDGRPDVVTANGSTAGVLLGQAGGSFAPVSTYSTGIGTTGLAVADVNGDGRPDIVTTKSGSNLVGVLLGQTGGSFAPVITYSTGPGSNPQGVAVADVNGDGRPDIVTGNTGNSTAGVLLGQAGGGWATVSTYAAGAVGFTLYGVAVADVNGDGRPDIVTANFGSDRVGVLLNTGTFTPLAAAPGAEAAEVALFPNPAHEGFAVQLPAAWGAVAVRAELRNALGQVVRQQPEARPASGAALTFATAGLAPGVYVLRVQAGSHSLTKRVVLD